MADWSRPSAWTEVAENPAAPAGLQQAATGWSYTGGPAGGPMEGAKGWYGGRNLEGPGSGWGTEWLNTAREQYVRYSDEAARTGRQSDFYAWLDTSKNPNATGVALWNDEERGIRAGDVWENGVKGDNLYDVMGEQAADVMLGEFMFKGDQKARMGRHGGGAADAWRRAVQEQIDANTELRKYGPAAEQYEEDVRTTQAGMQSGPEDDLAVGLGAAAVAGTAFATAAAAFSWTGPGALLAGAAAAAVAGGAAWMNRDQFTEVAARAKEKADRAGSEFGRLEGIAALAEGGGQLASMSLQPLQNAVQGLYDVKSMGDGRSKYYDDLQAGTLPGWVETANVGGAVADSLLTFSSPAAAGMYMTSMGATVLGKGWTGVVRDSVFNESRGAYDGLDGWKEHLAFYGSVGIDAVQMGQAGAVTRAAGGARRMFGAADDKGYQGFLAGGGTGAGRVDRMADRNWARLARSSDERAARRELVDGAGRSETVNGIKFFLNEQGEVVGSRLTTQILAPSEFARWIPTGFRARQMRALDQGQTAVDDLYRAALFQTESGSKFGDALLNGYAESVEELVQGYLEPKTVGEDASWSDLTRAAMYGAASGFGMSMGALSGRPGTAATEKKRARVLESMRLGREIDEKEWDERWSRMSTRERSLVGAASPREKEQIKRSLEVMDERMRYESLNSPFQSMAAQDMVKNAHERDSKNQRADNTLSLKGRTSEVLALPDGTVDEATYRADEAVMSMWQVVDVLRRRVIGFRAQDAELSKLLADAQVALDAARTGNDQTAIDKAQTRMDELRAREADTEGQTAAAEQLFARMRGVYSAYRDTTDRTRAEQLVDSFNSILDTAWDGTYSTGQPLTPQQLKMFRRAAEFQTTRHPLQDRGSFSTLRMRASKGLSRLGAHGSVHTHQSLLKVIGGDHDGDNRVTLHFMYLDPASRRDMLMGKFAYEQDVVEKDDQGNGLDTGRSRVWKLELDRPDGEAAYLRFFREHSADPGSDTAAMVGDMIEEITEAILDAYSDQAHVPGPFEQDVLIELLNDLAEDIRAGVPDAVVTFTEALMNHTPTAYEQLQQMGERNNRMELPWLMQLFNNAWDTTSSRIAHYNYVSLPGVPLRAPAQMQADIAYAKGRSVLRSVTMSEDLNLIYGSDPVRNTQHSHYTSTLHAAVKLLGFEPGQAGTHDLALQLAESYMRMGSGQTESDLDMVRGRDRLERRVLDWLAEIVKENRDVKDKVGLMMVLANTSVRDVEIVGENMVDVRDGQISLLQLLLRRSIQIEEGLLEGTPDDDPAWGRLRKLKKMTFAQQEGSYSASEAFLEIFGGMRAYDLIKDDAAALGPNVTLNQYMKMLVGMSARDRNNRFKNLRSEVSGYMRITKTDAGKDDRRDPPYSYEVFKEGRMNAYSVLVDAMRAVSLNQFKNMEDRDRSLIGKVEAGFEAWRISMDDWRQQFGRKDDGQEISDDELLEDYLQNAPAQMSRMLLDMMPEASRQGMFQITDGRVYTSKWVREMLLEEDPKKAAKLYFVMTKLEEWRVLSGVDLREEGASEGSAEKDGGRMVEYGRIKSRFLQTLYHVGREPTGLALQKFMLEVEKAPDIPSLLEAINSQPNWLGGRERLLAFHDDVALFESDPKDVWSANLPGQAQREAIATWGEKVASVGQLAVQTRINRTVKQQMLRQMKDELERMGGKYDPAVANAQSTSSPGLENLKLLHQLLENRKDFPDTIGPNAREQYFEAVRQGLIQMHNKGKADARVAPMGEPLALVDSWGVKQGAAREMDSLTSEDYDDILSNPTDLVHRRVEITLPDGSTTVLDFTTVEGTLEMLLDKNTEALAMAVIAPTERDVNTLNVSQIYMDAEDTSDFTKILQGSKMVDLLWEGDKPTLAQAYRYIQHIESHIRGQARKSKDPKDHEAALFPIMNLIDDFLVAYNQSVPVGGPSRDLHEELVKNVAAAIRKLSKVAVDKRPEMQRIVVQAMRNSVYTLDRKNLADLESLDSQLKDIYARQWVREQYLEKRTALREELDDTSTTPARKRQIEKALTELSAEMDKLADSKDFFSWTLPEFQSAEMLYNTWRIDWSQDPALIELQKGEIVRFLANNGNFRPFRDKSTLGLINKILELQHDNPTGTYDTPDVSPEEWDIAAAWMTEQILRRDGGSNFAGLGTLLDKNGALDMSVARYFDKSFSYLVEPLFDSRILDAAKRIKDTSRDNEVLTDASVAEWLGNTLFNPDKLQNWTGQVPLESLKLRKVIGGASVGLSVAVAGSDPVAFADYVGGSILSKDLPEPEHMSTAVIDIPDIRAGGVRTALSADPRMFVKLQNHFVKSVKVTSRAGAGIEVVDLIGHDTVDSQGSGYKVLHLDDLQRHLDGLAAQGHTQFQISIDYVDVDKKPWTPEWAHNLYFDGVGREAVMGATRGPVASLIFALAGLSKVGQQNPLNYATKGGASYLTYMTSDPSVLEEIRTKATSVGDYMSRLAMHMWGIDNYDTGPMLASDLPSLYKWAKMRHVVEVTDPATGEKTLMWPDEVIQRETSGPKIEWKDVRIIPLSDKTARKLWGAGGFNLGEGVVPEPVLNLQDMDRFPLLTKERLRRLGLDGLGKRVKPGSTVLARVVLPPKNYISEKRGTQRKSVREARIKQWSKHQTDTLDVRSMTSRPGIVNFNPVSASEKGDKAFADMVAVEQNSQLLSRLGIPYSSLQDLTRSQIAEVAARNLSKMKSSTAMMTWQHIHDGGTSLADGTVIPGYDLVNGVLTGAQSDGNFSGEHLSQIGPTYGDIVVIHLDSILRAGGDKRNAYRIAKRVISAYAARGVTIAIASSKGDQYFRNDIADWLGRGALGYTSYSNSRHIFVPETENSRRSRNEEAIRSLDMAVGVLTPKHATLGIASDVLVGTGASENTSYTDLEHDPTWKRTSAQIVPVALTRTSPDQSREYLFNLPSGPQKNIVVKELLNLLRSDEGRQWLTDQAKNKDGEPDPDAPRYRENLNGTYDPGVVYMEDALKRLRNMLEVGMLPTDEDSLLMVGDLIPIIDQQNNIVLLRHGFDIPSGNDLDTQFRKTLPGPASLPGRIAVAKGRLNDQQTATPPMRIGRVYTDPQRGIVAEGEWELDKVMKKVWEGLGFKSGATTLPENWVLPGRLSRVAGNNMRLTQFTSEKAIYGKAAYQGIVDNFRDAFVVFGVDFRPRLVNFFYGADPSRTDDQTDALWNDVQIILDEWSHMDLGLSEADARKMLSGGATFRYANELISHIFTTAGLSKPPPIQLSSVSVSNNPDAQLAQIFLAVLAMPGMKLNHIASTSGLLTVQNNNDSTARILQMPTVFTDALDDAINFPELRKSLFDDINASMPREPDDTPRFLLTETWDFYSRIIKVEEGPGKSDLVDWKPGKLQYIYPLPADENPAGLTQSGIGTKQQHTKHVTAVINAAAGGRIAIAPGESELTELEKLYNNNIWVPGRFKARPFGVKLERDETFYDMLRRIDPKDRTYSPFSRRLPAQELYLDRGTAKRSLYKQKVDKNVKDLWNNAERAQAKQKIDEALRLLGLYGRLSAAARPEIDYLVRQFVGRPGPASDQDVEVGHISGKVYIQALDLILDNITDKMNPLHGGAVFIPDRHFMQAVYRANLERPVEQRWAPRVREGGTTKSDSWDNWVQVLLGQYRSSNQEMRAMFLTDIDGFFHTWHDARPGLGDLPISFDQMRDMRLMSVKSNDALLASDPAYDPVISLDPGRQAVLHDPIILDSLSQTMDTLLGQDPTYNALHARDAEGSSLKEQLDKQKEWLASNKLPKQKRLRAKDYMVEGAFYANTTEYQNQFMKNLVNLSLTMRLANPVLWVSALMEVPARNALEHVINALTGSSISAGAGTTSRIADRLASRKALNEARAKAKAEGRKLSEAEEEAIVAQERERSGFKPKYSPYEIQLLNNLAQEMGQRKEWMAVMYDEMTFQQLVEGRNISSGSISKSLERAATFMSRATSDPRYGMKGTSVAKRYIEAVMETLALSQSSISVEQFVAEMSVDPLWLAKQYEGKAEMGLFTPHRAGMNRVAQVRSTKQTTLNKFAFGWLDSMMKSGSGTANIAGHMLKIPFMFTRFNLNALMTITGLTAWDQVAAMLLDGRNKPAFLAKNGKPETWNMSDVIETMDLHRTFMRSGATYSMVMALGMMAGGLGGDDEEERRRKRMAKYLHIPHYLDPLDAANDFRLADAMFLDSVPVLGSIFDDGKGNAVVMPHWIVKQFTSPILGISRFFETGDWKEIRNGFLDAFSVVPNSVVALWDRADVTATLLADQANKEAAKDTPQAMANASSMLISIVGIYEKALFENSFINSLRNGADKYDRNPYAIPGRDPVTGEIARYPGTNTPMSQDDALVTFKNSEGEMQQGFMSRQGKDGELHQYAENNLTFAALMSLFTGLNDSTYLRKNMVPRIQEIEMPEKSKEEIEALVYAAWSGQGGSPPLSRMEIISLLKEQVEASGGWWDQDVIEAEAEELFQAQEGQLGALSILSPEGKEILTKAGTDSVFNSLSTGALQIGDKALDGFGASYEMRQEIAADWGQRLVQEGLDLGLSQEQAFFRAKRFWFGDETTGDPGLRSILFDKRIPVDNDLKYFQLNHTYAIGPDGKPWATPFPKMGVLQSMGLPWPTQMAPPGPGLGIDENGRIIDLTVGEGINTGLAGLEKIPDLVSDMKPDDDAFEKGANSAEGGADSSRKFGRSRGYGRRYGGGGGGGGGGYTPQMRALPSGTAARFDGIQMINSSNPIIRRADVNRQRIWSERGRLKQWQ